MTTAPCEEPSLLSGAVRGDAVLLGDGGQLFQEFSVQNDRKHTAFGFLGDGRAGRKDTERRRRQRVGQGAIGEDDVAMAMLQTL